jgi:uncharacterized membrane protein (UPF0127 family)
VTGLRLLAVALASVVTGLAASGGAGATESTTAVLRLDGVRFRPEIAKTPAQRARGLMHRTRAPEDGMLFVFPETTTGGFWMKDTLVPLTIVFFDTRGKRVRKLAMTPCRTASCPIYDPGRSYRFALELRANDPRRGATIGPRAALARLVRASS